MFKLCKYSIILIISSIFLINLNSCAKKSDWTTNSPEALDNFLIGRDYKVSFNFDNAIKHYRASYKADTNFAMVALGLTDAYYHTGFIDSAKRYLKKSIKLSKNCSRFEKLIIKRAYYSFKMNKDKSQSITDTLIAEYSDKFYVKVIKSNLAFSKKDYKRARKLYFEILEENPDYAMAYNMIAYSYMLDGYYRDAMDYFRKYVEAAPNILNPYDSMAEFYMITGKYQQAIDLLEKFVAEKKNLLDQNNFLAGVIYLKIANGYRNLGKYQKALEYAKIARMKFPPTRRMHNLNSFIFNMFKELDMIEDMKIEYEAIKDHISNFEASYLGIILNIAEKKNNLAGKQINDFCSKNRNNDMHYIKFLTILEGEQAFSRERYGVAADKFKTAYIIPTDLYPEIIENKYYISLGLGGEHKMAIEGFKKILKKNPNNPTSLYYISQFYFEDNSLQKSKNYLNHFFTLWAGADPGSPLLVKAQELQRMIDRTN